MATRMQKILFVRLKNNRGSVLLVTYFLTATLLIFGAAFLMISSADARRAAIQHKTDLAFYIAEAGIEQVIYELKDEFETGDGSWLDDVTIGGTNYMPNTTAFYTVYSQKVYPSGSYTHAFSQTNDNHYTVGLRNITGEEDLWIRSTGEVDGITQTIQVYAKIINVSPWNNAIFGGAGGSGTMVNGNVNIYGSVHILGNGLDAGDNAINLGGTSELVGNNYNIGPQGLDPLLKAKIPDLPQVTLNEGTVDEETVDTLSAELRVKNGIVSLSGNSTVGQENDSSGNTVKEMIDGAYVSDGYGGTKGIINVHSDNGTNEAYDLGEAVHFPSLDDPYPSNPSQNYHQYFADPANALVLSGDELSHIVDGPGTDFAYGNCSTNCITKDVDGNLYIQGLVYVADSQDFKVEQVLTQDDIDAGRRGANISYTGTGTILVSGNVEIDANFVTTGDDSFPANIIGIMTPNNITLGGSSQKDVMGLFFAGSVDVSDNPIGEISTNFQTDIIGTVITNNFDFSNQVPSIFQVPEVLNNLPLGLIANEMVWYMNMVSWQKCNSQTATCGGV